MFKLFLSIMLALLSVHSLAKKNLSELEAEHLAEQFISIYESNVQISNEAVYQLSESIGSALSYVILKKPRWRGNSQSLLICTTKILNSGVCKELSGHPSPWMGPQEFINMVWPDDRPVVKNISYYPSNASLYLFYSFLDKKPELSNASVKVLQDPSLSSADIPWNKISNKPVAESAVNLDDKVTKSPDIKIKVAAAQPSGVTKIPYKDFYIPGKEINDYDSSYFTVRLASFDNSRDARIFKRTYKLSNAFTITTRVKNKRVHHVYFGVFPSDEDVYKAIETLTAVLIRKKPTLHSIGQAQLEEHKYESWKQARIQELRRVVSERLGDK